MSDVTDQYIVRVRQETEERFQSTSGLGFRAVCMSVQEVRPDVRGSDQMVFKHDCVDAKCSSVCG